MKKLFSMILAIAMVLSLSTFVMAAPGTGDIVVNNVGDKTILDLYRILTYEVNANGTYSSADFTETGYKGVFITEINKKVETDKRLDSDASTADVLLCITNNLKGNSAFAKDLGEALQLYITAAIGKAGTKTADNAAEAGGKWTFSGLEHGYYLLLDGTAYTGTVERAVLVDNLDEDVVNVYLKSTNTTIPEKKADADTYFTGDTVEFTVKVVIPVIETKNAGNVYTIEDNMSAGLKFTQADLDALAITIGGAEVTDISYKAELLANGFTLTFGGDADPTAGGLANYIGQEMVIEYTATVTDVVTDDLNGMYNGVFTNDGTPVVVTVYSYGIDITKTNEFEEVLEGVEFNLYLVEEFEKDNNGATIIPTGATPLTFVKNTDGKYIYNKGVDAIATLTTDEDGKLVIWGLAEGNYLLEETKWISGYNPIAVKEIVIKDLMTDGEYTGKVDDDDDINAYYDLTVVNKTGVELPGTGGMGTAMFTILGTIIMAGAAFVLVINKKRIFNV